MALRSNSASSGIGQLFPGMAIGCIVALTIAWAGCGPSVTSGDTDTSATSGDSASTGAGICMEDAGPPDAGTCPPNPPSDGSPCDTDGLACYWGGYTDHAGGFSPEVSSTCCGGVWKPCCGTIGK